MIAGNDTNPRRRMKEAASVGMRPRLIVVSGALRGTVYDLAERDVYVGREPSNAVCISDPAASRRHCLVRNEGGRFSVVDLDSFNGTIVNGRPVMEQQLEHGDQIAVGDTLFLFLVGEDEGGAGPSLVQFEEPGSGLGSTVRLRRQDAIYLGREGMQGAFGHNPRTERDLRTLLKISSAVNSIRGVKPLQEELLRLTLEAVPAEQAAVLLTGGSRHSIVSFMGLSRDGQSDGLMRVSRTVVEQVLREGVSLLSNNVPRSDLGDAESLVASKTASLLCSPLVFFENVIGAVYLSSSEQNGFDDGHLQLVTGISSLAAVALENALHYEWAENENQQLQAELRLKHQMIGSGARMRQIYHFISKLAPTDSTVLIRGESGTGKELAAHALHLNSKRAEKPFVAINCAALPDTLFESEFFGHEKGAFSGASAQKQGLLEVAEGGTLFLDEVGELPAVAQAKLLRVLESNEFRRVGGTKAVKVNVRIIAATNKNLEEAIEQKAFRPDLYHRLNVLSFEMPPLRERQEDVLLLAQHFILQFNQKHGRRIIGVSPESRERLMNYDWPGNVRELRNVVERAVVMENAELLTTEFLPLPAADKDNRDLPPATSIHDSVKEAQKLAILRACGQANGNYTEAARLLGIHPNHLHRIIRNLNLKETILKEIQCKDYTKK
ncbi:MAG: sigma 54-interacting transcriptional regulator [Acidobacteriota bacterium]|nr:sigma 54-interacting transcriptional regulator [Acidobacteriota bacterium]